ncbi:DUF1236 domain-containing protein [Mesorhizobium sp. RMAD-H1]|uniref:DUF1236 domain-containing protein n=1 Tax=Mesorhizobium sp. RMAD-H1 TaxID=2587065 RepID=UPI00161F6BEE|nr:DUF1236 domain-containing protein [Mesorhizobium sp. RMAD-H1]MBB2973041.1 hypothetical protein [Mesorhizobium sp. RMAD-H1]
MKNIMLKSAVILALGVAPGVSFAQTEMPKKNLSQQSEGQMQKPAESSSGEQGAATTGQQTEGQAGAAPLKEGQQPDRQTQGSADEGTNSQRLKTDQQTEDSTGTRQLKRDDQQSEDRAETPEEQDSGQQGVTRQKTTDPTDTQDGGTAGTREETPDNKAVEMESEPSTETTGSVNVTTEQQTEIKQVITETKVEPVRDVDFDVNVGVKIPQTVELQPLPPRIIKVVPRYEDYRYFLLADGRIVIVDPDTLEIVLVIA